jgi:integrase
MFKRGGIWYFSIDGVRRSSGTSDRKRAEALERKLEQEAWDRSNGLHVPGWDEACLSWLEEHQHQAGYKQQCIMAKWWKPHLTGMKLPAIDKDLVHRIVSRHREIDVEKPSGKNTTANYYVGFVGKIIRAASNLKPKFRVYPEPNEEKRWLRPEEWPLLQPELYGDLRDICTFALASGLRESNDMLFEWSWLHQDDTVAILPAAVTKTAKPYGIPLNLTAQTVIKRRREAKVRHPRYVFTNQGKVWGTVMLLRALYPAVERAGIAPMTFHTFRHTFGSWLAQKGVSDAVRCRLGCWSLDEGASGGYVHFDVESLRVFSEMLDPILSQSKPIHSQPIDVAS